MKIPSFSFALLCCAALLGLCLVTLAADEIAELQKSFDREVNSVHKAKILEKLGKAEFATARKAQQGGNFSEVGLVWEKYRDNVRDALSALEKQHPDAEKQSNGYRQLEFSVREGLREIDQTILEAPDDYKPPLRLVRQDLFAMDDEMIKKLFPRRVEHEKSPNKPPEPGERL
jgi:hypothetical protein